MRAPLLFFLPALRSTPTTGGEIYNLALARGLADSFDLRTMTFEDLGLAPQAAAPELARAAASFVERERLPASAVIEDTYAYRTAEPLRAALRDRGFGPFVAFGQALYPDRFRSPLVRARLWWRLARYLRGCDHHVVVSPAMRRAYRWLGLPAERIDVVLPGFDLAAGGAPSRGPACGALRIVTAGSYVPSKGQHLVIEALGRLCRRRPELGISLRAYGSRSQAPDYVAALETQAARDLPRRARLGAALPQAQLFQAFSESDVFVFPATGEGLGMVVVEAMLCGCVPVVADCGPLPDLVGRDGTAGLVVARRAGAIERAVERLAVDPDWRTALARGARARACHLARDWPTTVERFAGIVAPLAQRRGGPAGPWGGRPQAPRPGNASGAARSTTCAANRVARAVNGPTA